MTRYVGVDLHRRRSVIVVLDADGTELSTKRIDNDPLTVGLEIEKAGPEPEVVLEATWGWHWAADVITEAGGRVHLAHPLGIKGFENRRVKNDRVDARLLADLQRMGRLPESWIPPESVRHQRELVRYRRKRPDNAALKKLDRAGKALRRAAAESDEIRRRLWLARAADLAIKANAVLVGGAAVNLHTGSYRPTDIDMCAYLDLVDRESLADLGFRHLQGDHFEYTFPDGERWLLEFPDSQIDGWVSVIELGDSETLNVISLDMANKLRERVSISVVTKHGSSSSTTI